LPEQKVVLPKAVKLGVVGNGVVLTATGDEMAEVHVPAMVRTV
jgi:hypothetical protein